MTLINEFGIDELFKNNPETLLYYSVSYIETHKISLIQFIGLLSLFGYTYNKYE
ncbi:hypothetical protein HDR58_05960, partial [bacterium]|nr:hypothetical protein [bacterium]